MISVVLLMTRRPEGWGWVGKGSRRGPERRAEAEDGRLGPARAEGVLELLSFVTRELLCTEVWGRPECFLPRCPKV